METGKTFGGKTEKDHLKTLTELADPKESAQNCSRTENGDCVGIGKRATRSVPFTGLLGTKRGVRHVQGAGGGG